MTEQIDPLVARLWNACGELAAHGGFDNHCRSIDEAAALLRSQAESIADLEKTASDAEDRHSQHCHEVQKGLRIRAEAAEARLADALAALEKVERIISYPISSEIKERGFDVRTDDDSVSHAVEFIRATLSRLTAEQKGGDE